MGPKNIRLIGLWTMRVIILVGAIGAIVAAMCDKPKVSGSCIGVLVCLSLSSYVAKFFCDMND